MQAPASSALRALRALAPFGCLYASFGATFGLIGSGVPLVLRARGLPLEAVGLLQLVYVPIGITFLWAPLLDRYRLPGLPHRLGWIALAQGLTVVSCVVLAITAALPLAWVAAVALVISVAAATMDVALEALVVETVPSVRRPAVTTAKLVGSSLGTMLGIALVTAAPERIDPPRALALVALLDAALLLPMLRYPEAAARLPAPEAGRKMAPRTRRRIGARLRFVARHAAVVGADYAAAIMLASAPSLILIDMKVSLPAVGFMSGPLTTGLTVSATLLSGFTLSRVASHRLVSVLAGGTVASGIMFIAATATNVVPLGFAAAILTIVCEAALGVPIFAILYRWAEGEHAATDYAVLFGCAFLVSFPARVLGPMLAGAVGWPAFFAIVVPAYAVAAALLARAMARTEHAA